MAYIQGEGRCPAHCFRSLLTTSFLSIIFAASSMHVSQILGFERAQAADTGRPGYDPGDLLKLCLYGYLNHISSSRRLEVECRRNVELM